MSDIQPASEILSSAAMILGPALGLLAIYAIGIVVYTIRLKRSQHPES